MKVSITAALYRAGNVLPVVRPDLPLVAKEGAPDFKPCCYRR